MKRIFLISLFTLLLVTVLSSCVNESTNVSPDTDVETKASSKKKVDEDEVKDGPLTEIDQWVKVDDGTKVTLKGLAQLDKVLDLDPIQLTIRDVKLMERVGGDLDGNVIQVSYTVENFSEKEIMFHAINIITTNTKRQIDVMLENTSGSAGLGQYYGEVKEDGFIVVPYPEESFEGLTSIKLITGAVWDDNQPDKYHESITQEVEFE